MDIFKLFFQHDLVLSGNHSGEMSLEDFMKPMPTCSTFYLTGTRHQGDGEHEFGVNALNYFEMLQSSLEKFLDSHRLITRNSSYSSLKDFSTQTSSGEIGLLIPKNEDFTSYSISNDENVLLTEIEGENAGHHINRLQPWIEQGVMVLFKVDSHDGFDLKLISRDNIYEQLFQLLQPLTENEDFRFFSVNGKKLQSERHFYFDTWTLHRPPHGAEEVTPNTILYPGSSADS